LFKKSNSLFQNCTS